jgi:ketosteroid isomerase-like protein
MPDLHPNAQIYLSALDAFNRDDLAALSDYVASDVVYRIPGRSAVAGEFRGIAGFVEALTRLRRQSAGTIQVTPLTVLADSDNLIARGHVTAQLGGRRLDTENCYALRFADGKLVDGQVFVSEPEKLEDFWGISAANRSSVRCGASGAP